MAAEMAVPIKVRLPRPPNFLALEVPHGDVPERKSGELPNLYVGDLTPEQAREVAERIRDSFLEHARECRASRKAGGAVPR